MELALAFIVGSALLVALAAPPILQAIHAVIDKDMTVHEGVAIVFLVIGLIYKAVRDLMTGAPATFLLYFGLMYAPWLALTAMAHLAERQLNWRMVTDDERRYWASLQRDPKNAGAHEYLGRLYKKRGLYDAAIHHLSESLRLSPEQPSVKWQLNDAIAEREKQRAPGTVTQCLHCRQTVPPGPFCPLCGHPMVDVEQEPAVLDFLQWLQNDGRPYLWGFGIPIGIVLALDFILGRSLFPAALLVLVALTAAGTLYYQWNRQRNQR